MAERGHRPGGKAELVGRTAELTELGRALTDAEDGRPRTVLVSGEAGVGKTALVTTAAEEATERGFEVVWGRAWGSAGAPPFWPWIQVLRGCQATDAGRHAMAAAARGPLVGELATGEPRDPGTAAPGDRFALFDAVSQVLQTWTATSPVAVIIEDAHWADEGTWQMALFVARNLSPGARLTMWVTCREAETRLDPELAALWHRLCREGIAVPLSPLGGEDAATLFARAAGYELSAPDASRLHTMTGGNPLLVEEVARLAADAARSPGAPLDTLLESSDVPAAHATVRRAHRLLGEAGRHALEVVAAAGGVLSLELLARMVDLSPDHVRDSLGPAASLGVVHFDDGAVAFRHELFRRACYDDVPTERAHGLHRCLAEALEEAGDDANVFAIADHHLRAGGAGSETAGRWAQRAAERALASFAPGVALSYVDRGLTMRAVLSAGVRCDLWTGRITALTGLGRIAGIDDALVEALDAADELGDPVRAARAVAAMSGVYFHRGTTGAPALLGRLNRVLDGLGRDRVALRAALLAEISSHSAWGPPGARRAAGLEALEMARSGGDPVVLATALQRASWRVWSEPELWLEMASELVELGDRLQRPDSAFAGRLRVAAHHVEHGQHAAFDGDIEAIASIASLTSLPQHQWATAVLRSCRAAIHGRYPLSQRLAEQAVKLLPDHPAALTTWYAETGVRTMLCGGLGDHVEVGETFLDHSGDWSELQLPYCGMAASHALLGNLEQARSALSRFAPGVHEWAKDPLWLPSAAFLGWTAAELGEVETAQMLYAQLAPFEDRMLVLNTGVPVAYWGSVAWVLGALAAVLGRGEDARAHFEHALDRQSAFGDRPWLAHVKVRYARFLLDEGTDENRLLAASLLAEAREAASELGLQRVLAEIEETEERMASPAPGAVLFRNEGDYWAVGDPRRPSRVKAMRGFEHIARLLDNPGKDIHVLELVTAGGSPSHRPAAAGDGIHVADGGEAVLDEAAKAAYRRRIQSLQEDIDDAEELGDGERAARAREELEVLTDHLAAALGLGGRDRRMGSEAERARVAVTKAVRAALDRLAGVEPAAAAQLRARIRTGMLCRYDGPDTDAVPLRVLR